MVRYEINFTYMDMPCKLLAAAYDINVTNAGCITIWTAKDNFKYVSKLDSILDLSIKPFNEKAE